MYSRNSIIWTEIYKISQESIKLVLPIKKVVPNFQEKILLPRKPCPYKLHSR